MLCLTRIEKIGDRVRRSLRLLRTSQLETETDLPPDQDPVIRSKERDTAGWSARVRGGDGRHTEQLEQTGSSVGPGQQAKVSGRVWVRGGGNGRREN